MSKSSLTEMTSEVLYGESEIPKKELVKRMVLNAIIMAAMIALCFTRAGIVAAAPVFIYSYYYYWLWSKVWKQNKYKGAILISISKVIFILGFLFGVMCGVFL